MNKHANPYAPDRTPQIICGNCGTPQDRHVLGLCPWPTLYGTFRASTLSERRSR